MHLFGPAFGPCFDVGQTYYDWTLFYENHLGLSTNILRNVSETVMLKITRS
jgi:hypothetical protein